MEAGKSDDAIKLASEVLDEDMDNAWALYIMTRAFHDLKRPGLSAVCGRSMVQFMDTYEAWTNYGLAFLQGFEHDRAIEYTRKAIELNPKYYPAVHNLATAYQFSNQPELGLMWAEKAHAMMPEDYGPVETQGYCNLMMQRWTPGWRQYNQGLGMHKDRTLRCYTDDDVPFWDGTKGQTVVLFGEQGIGDEVLFSQYVPEMIKDCNLIVETCQTMYELFKNSFACTVYPTRYVDDPPWVNDHKIDAKLSMCQGMEFYRYKNEQFIGKPHLQAPEEKRKWWRAILDQYPGEKIGIAWSAGLPHTGKKHRTMGPDDFLPILKDKSNTYICLEYKDSKEHIERLRKNHDVELLDFGNWINGHKDYSDTAALVAELDRVVAATTSVVDLAGSMGVSCDTFVPTIPFWRQAGERNVWYKSVNWVHQDGTWGETVEKYWRSNAPSIHRVRSATAN